MGGNHIVLASDEMHGGRPKGGADKFVILSEAKDLHGCCVAHQLEVQILRSAQDDKARVSFAFLRSQRRVSVCSVRHLGSTFKRTTA